MITVACPHCQAELSLPPRRVLVHVEVDPAIAGELLFTCLACHRTAAVPVDAAVVADLLSGGATHLTLSAPGAD